MFKFLKRVFLKVETLEQVNVEQIHKWFEEKTKELESKFSEKLKILRKEIEEKINHAYESMKALENASLQNPNITVREQQFMEGNRKSYLQRADLFLKEIKDIIDYELHFFLNNYPDYTENFVKSTQRAYRILSEFFSHEVREIALKIQDMDAVVERMKSDEDVQGFSKIEKIRKELLSINNKLNKKGELKQEIDNLKQNLTKLKQKIHDTEKEKKDILASSKYKSYLNDKIKKEEAEEKIKNLKSSLYSHFSSLERPLRKYERIAFKHDKLVAKYSIDALKTLVSDFELKIVEILKAMEKSILDGKIILKNKDKVLNIISKLDQKFFTNFHKDYNGFLKNIKELEKNIKESEVKERLDSVINELERFVLEKDSLLERTDSRKQDLDGIDIDHLREKLRKDIEGLLKIKIEYV